MRNKIVFYLNGVRREAGPDEAGLMLADYLRGNRGLTGTKVVCAEGDCGACTVLRLFPHVAGTDAGNYLPVNSCITLVAQLDGASLVTVDALKDGDDLHEAQRAMIACHGSQCGFCTPGFVMALTGLVEEKLARGETRVDVREAKNCMTGNLCRCTGYLPIIDAALAIDLAKCRPVKERFYGERQERDLAETFAEGVLVEGGEFSFFAPRTLDEAVTYLARYPDTRILGSGTDLGVVHNKRKTTLSRLLSLHLITPLYEVGERGGVVSVGARVTHAEFRHFLKARLPEFATYLDVFAGPQIKNIGTVVGNVANASPIGDTPPALLALGATVVARGPAGEREIPIEKFFLAYRKTALVPGELITHVRFPLPPAATDLRFYKSSNRKDLDISAVNLAVRVTWKDEEKREIRDVAVAAGGVAPIPYRFFRTEEFLKQRFDVDGAVRELHAEVTPIGDLRASAAYRRVILENFFRSFFSEVAP
jgi:xanthine dehydrogenase small subunit